MTDTENNKNSNSPVLRFPGFTEPWKKCRLGDYIRIFSGESPNCVSSKFGIIPYYKVEQLNWCEKYLGETPYLSQRGKNILPEGCVVFSKRGAAILTNKVRMNLFPINIDTNLMGIKADNSFISDQYLFYFILRARLSRIADTSTIPQINNIHINPITIHVPSLEEQEKITRSLGLLDERIATQRRLIDKLETLIKGVRDLFIRKTISDGKWVKLGDICHITTGKLDANAMEENGQYPFFTCAEKPFCINNYAFDTEALLISGNGANLGYINYYNGKFNAYQRTYVLDKFTEDIQFIKIALQMLLPKRIAIEKSTSNTPYIVQSTLSDMRIFIPSKDLQRRTTNLMLRLEEDMCVQTSLLASYNRMKSYLLQQMFI